MTGPILLTGASGQVGGALLDLLPGAEVMAPDRQALDLGDADSIRNFVRETRPRYILNPAAYTAVDKAESDRDQAFAINAVAPQILGEEAQRIGARVLHFSTDYVFSGSKDQPYTEQDTTGPLGVYGASKLAGEQALAASGANYVILRTSWVYGATGKNFLLTILKLAREREELRIVADQQGAPTWSRDLARLALHLISSAETRALEGVFHATGAGETTWHGFAAEALRLAAEREPQAHFARVVPIPSSDYPTPARRPANSRLDCRRLAVAAGWQFPQWQESLRQVLDEVQTARRTSGGV